ncbi:MAG: PH domain-containing protein [Alphaproteobacteria bacterium]|nr:PH domain-containing protein [Alphaproteobacteria bacterium]
MDFMNDNWKQYLKSGDRVFLHTKTLNSAGFMKSIIPGIALSVFLSIFFGIIYNSTNYTVDFGVPIFFGMIMVILFVPLFYARSISFHFILTNSGVYSVGGLISKQIRFVPYGRITDAAISRGIISQIADTASIGISTPGHSKSAANGAPDFEITIVEIPDYHKVRQEILKRIK